MRDLIKYKYVAAAFRPERCLQILWRLVPIGSFDIRLAFDIVTPAKYAYSMYQAALTAQRLGIPKISAIEFGVAGGNGLLAIERISTAIEEELGVGFEVYGFDTGTGMPPPSDYRDQPYIYEPGQFQMDEQALKSKLTKAQLVLGDIKDTVTTMIEDHTPAPIGFVSFDVVYYSSTSAALRIFDCPLEYLLPRVYCHFDDIIGDHLHVENDWLGELLAIREFNEKNEDKKIAPIYGLRHKRIISSEWHDQLFVLHNFQHPQYNTYISDHPRDRQLPLRKPRRILGR